MVSAVERCTVKHRVLNYLHIDSQKYTNQTIIYLHHTMKALLIGLEIIFIIYVVVNFLFQLIFIFPLFLGMVMYAKQFKTKEKQKLTEIKN